jgi:hypothetical protein
MTLKLPALDEISLGTPLRLGVAAAIAFPDGTMTASGLRREAARGRLVVERIANKDYTTLAQIERMRELCRVEARVRTFGSDLPVESTDGLSPKQFGSLSTATAMSARDALKAKLEKRKSV